MGKNYCRWYDQTSAMKRAYDMELIDEKWVKDYCWNAGKDCIRKKKFEEEGYISPDWILPDGSEHLKLKKIYSN
ncbi:MAG: uracil-DNA glycosylase [Promethearchaeota archaeon]